MFQDAKVSISYYCNIGYKREKEFASDAGFASNTASEICYVNG